MIETGYSTRGMTMRRFLPDVLLLLSGWLISCNLATNVIKLSVLEVTSCSLSLIPCANNL